MGFLDKIKETGAAVTQGLKEAGETMSSAITLLRRRVAEKEQIAMAHREDDPRVIRSDKISFGNGVEVFQIDEDTISVGGEQLSTETVARPTVAPKIIQHDLNSDFLPFGWSCRLGSGKNLLFVAAYEGVSNGDYPGQRILVVKNSKDQIINIIKPSELTKKPDIVPHGGLLLKEGLPVHRKDAHTLVAGNRKVSYEQLMSWIQPGTRISDDATGITVVKILSENNILNWSCDLGEGDGQISLTAYESKDKSKKRILVITDTNGKIRGEIFPFHLES